LVQLFRAIIDRDYKSSPVRIVLLRDSLVGDFFSIYPGFQHLRLP